MSSVLHPKGPGKAAVYWRRRVLVLLAGLAVIAGLVLFIVWLVSPRGDAALPSTGASGETRACEASDLKVSLTRFKREWPDLQKPGFTGTIMNNSTTACVVDLGTEASLLVVSGADRIYSSTDCAVGEPSPQPATLGPGESQETSVVWDRIRSDAACSSGLPTPRPGTYRATWEVLGVTSSQEVFVLQ